MKKLFLISISLLPALMFAASFSPYLGDEDWGGQGAGSDFLQNFVTPDDDGGKARPGDIGYEDGSLNDYTDRVIEIGEYYCPYCQKNTDDDDAYFECLSEIYDAGVLPVKDGDGKIIRFEFPECEAPQCPIHHVYGYAADTEGNITEITPPDDVDPMGQTIEKPRLPVGEPFVMLLFAGVYAVVRKRQNAAKA